MNRLIYKTLQSKYIQKVRKKYIKKSIIKSIKNKKRSVRKKFARRYEYDQNFIISYHIFMIMIQWSQN